MGLIDWYAIKKNVSEGDEQAFSQLFYHYAIQLRPLVARYSQVDADIDEILQETFLRVWLHRDQLPGIENLDAWIARIASRECLNLLRKNLKNRKCTESFSELSFASPETPELSTRFSEISSMVHVIVQEMPEQRRRIYQMSRVEGLKPAQIAEALHLSVSTVKNTLNTALIQIRKYLQEQGHLMLIGCILLIY